MAEYMVKVKMTAAGTQRVPIKKKVLGVYSDVAVKLAWDFNGEVADITPAGVQIWEPRQPFAPAETSALIITAAAASNIMIRME